MSGRIIPLHGDLHEEISALLPWYVTGRLDDDERARVEAHLKTCPQCQSDVAAECKLQAVVADLSVNGIEDADDGWTRLQSQVKARPQRLVTRRLVQQWRGSAPWLRWAAAAQLAALVVGGGGALWWQVRQAPKAEPAVYHALGSAPETPAGNVVVVFRPDITERDLRQTLRDSHARLVDGPTAADAYILHVAPKDRDATLATLRNRPAIVLAEPIDADGAPGATP